MGLLVRSDGSDRQRYWAKGVIGDETPEKWVPQSVTIEQSPNIV